MNRGRWFKHYNEASQGATLRTLWDNGDYEAYGLFWMLLEMVSRWENLLGHRGKIEISWSVLARETGWKPTKCRRVLARISSVSKIELEEKQNGNVSFLVPNWLEFQENRGGKREAKKQQKPGRYKNKEERDKKPLKSPSPEVEEVIAHLNAQTGADFRANTRASSKDLLARIGEKFTVEQLKRVVDFKASQWREDEKMRAYLRPQTLFGEKFESYLSEATLAEPEQQFVGRYA